MKSKLRRWLLSIAWVLATWRWLESFWKVSVELRPWMWCLVAMPGARNTLPSESIYAKDSIAVKLAEIGFAPLTHDVYGYATISIGNVIYFETMTIALYSPLRLRVPIWVPRGDDLDVKTDVPIRVTIRGSVMVESRPVPIAKRIRRTLERVTEYGRYL